MDHAVISTKRRAFLQRGFAGGAALAANITLAREGIVTDRDLEIMRELVAFTRKSFATPFPVPFGSIVVRTGGGDPVARRVNQVGALKDPTAHAEMQAIRAACNESANLSLAGCTLYTTAEPCAMCMGAALWAELDRVVYGATIDDVGRHINQLRLPARDMVKYADHACEVTGPVERAACNGLFEDPAMAPSLRLWKKR